MISRVCCWSTLAICLFMVCVHAAAAPVNIDAANGNLLLGDQFTVLADRDGSFAYADVLAGRHDQARVSNTRSPPNLGYPKHPFWAKLELRNNGTTSVERLLVLWRGSTHLQRALIETQLDGGPPLPAQFSEAEDVRARHSIIRLQLPAHSTTRIAVRVETYTALSFDYRLLTDSELAGIDRIDYWFFGLLAGITTAIGIYVLALFFALRERLYLVFAAFAMSNFLYQFHIEGYAYLLWPAHLRPWGNALGTFAGTVFSLMILQFIRDYMTLSSLVPRLDRWLVQPVMGMLLTVFVLFPLAPWLGNTVAAVGVIAGTVVSSFASLRGSMLSRPVWSFLLATIGFFALGVVHLLKRLGVVPDLQSLALVLQIGSGGTTIAFAVAVMVRLRRAVEVQRSAQLDYADRLEHKVTERTSQLLESKESAERALAQLKSTQRQLLEADKMASLGQLVAGVSHEVNTPLGVAVTASSHLTERSRILQNQLANDSLSRSDLESYILETREAGAMIERNLERAAHLIRSFKQVSVDRTSDGRRRFELATQISELIDSLRVSWKRRPVTLSVDCPSGIELDSFPGALGQVLTNLIQNSLLHAFDPEETGHMRVIARPLDASRVEIVFEDDGKGMTQATLARIFDPFFTTKRNQGGTGLGLNIVYNLVVQKLGGEIEASSKPGQGLRLCMRLPTSAPTGAETDDED
ncbi:MAG: sensor histidine kinase [Pseudomarimonas sp.]